MHTHTTTSPLVAFLYELMRDEAPPGAVERIMQSDETCRKNNPSEPFEYVLSNGYLGAYAEDVAERLLRHGTKNRSPPPNVEE